MNATTRVPILRTATGTVDDYGDPIDNNTVAASGIPASIIEQTRQTMDPTTQEPRVVRFLIGRLYSPVDVRQGDRIKDEMNGGTVYIIDTVTRPQNAVGLRSVRLDLRREGE